MSTKTWSLSSKLLIGRLLTRSGDQAWDFAVPLALLSLVPGEVRVAALYYLIVRLFLVVLLPRITALIDEMNRLRAARLGISLQFIGVLLGAIAFFALSYFKSQSLTVSSPQIIGAFLVLLFGGVLSSFGSSFMDIAIANDLVPSGISEAELTAFNSRFRQVDLFTEVAAPIAAGFLLVMGSSDLPMLGFYLVALWNLISFFPEYGILTSIFHERPDLSEKRIVVSKSAKVSFLKKLTGGWRSFFREPVALVVAAYAILWLSVLSPHGVLLTAFLKDGWKLPEWEIGLFRGLGAVFGLAATVIFPFVEKKIGLIQSSKSFVIYQAITVAIALAFFFSDSRMGQIGFLAFVLLSRIGVYGFGLGEMQIRQLGIRPSVRGEVNGFASALTGIATLGLFASGVLLPSTNDFVYLIIASVVFVILAALVFSFWAWRTKDKAFLGVEHEAARG